MSELAQQLIAENKAKHARGEDASYLDLGNCGLTELPDLSGMEWLETLILSDWWEELDVEKNKWVEFKSQNIGPGNKIQTNPPTPLHLPQLKKLVARDLGISNGSFLEKLTGLTWFDLSHNQISNGRFLEKLTRLTSLDLGFNYISDGRFLEKLTGLTSLNLSFNQIRDGRFLEKLTGLTSLDLHNNEISDGSFLGKLTGLTSLDLWGNQIRDGRFLEKLTGLTSLNLMNNQISDGRFLEKLTGLTSLDLSFNQISDGRFLEKLTGLTTLNLSSNKISEWSFLEKLTGLTSLDLSFNQISDGRFLEKLTGLTTLNLSSNKISEWSFLEKLTGLTSLDLRGNQISDGRFLEKLTGLTSLDLSSNKISEWSFLEKLTDLTKIDLSNNQLQDLTPFLYFMLKKRMQVVLKESYQTREGEINLKDNPLTNPPVEIVQQGNEAILSYFKSLEGVKAEELVTINEIKILLVGEGMAGKTSLLKQIKGLDFQEKESQTHGVNIEKLSFDTLPLFKQYGHLAGVTGRFWDFGGQEIMHASHQFFLSNRSVYVLVLDSRTDAKKEEWLKHIEKFGGNSPTVVAINKIDENRNYDVERRTLNEKFPFIGNRFHKVSCAAKEGLAGLAKELAQLIPETEIFKTKFAPAWVAVKEQLEIETAACNYIDQQRFEAICAENQVHDKGQQKTLLNYLDSLGIALHFENLGLKNFYVLDPHWVTIGVYKIINSPSIEGGVFEESMLDHILNVEQVKKTEYDPAKDKTMLYSDAEQQYLVKIMQKFELLFEYAKGKYLVPDLLPKEPTMDYAFDETAPDHIRFVLKYDFFPPTLMPRFIIRIQDDVQEVGRLWRSGVELHPKSMDAQAIVKADKSEKRIDICVYGNTMAKREYFAFILKTLGDIHKTYEKLEVKRLMPIPGHFDELVEYEELLGLENMGEDELKIGKLGKKFSVSNDFLDKISTKQQRMEEKRKQGDIYNFNVHGGNIGNIAGKQGDVKQEVNQDATPSSSPKVSSQNEPKMNKFYLFVIIGFLLGAYSVYEVLNSPDGGKASITTDGVTVEKLPQNTNTPADVAPANVYTVQVPIKINGEIPHPDQIGYMRATHAPALTAELTSGGLFLFRGLEIPKDKLLVFELFSKDGSSAGLAQAPFVDASSNGVSTLNTVQFTGKLDKKRNRYINITVAPEFKIQNVNTVGDGNTTSQQ